MRACCQNAANLSAQPTTVAGESVAQCGVCGARHYALVAPAGRLGLRGAPLGDAIPPLDDAERLAFASAVAEERAASLRLAEAQAAKTAVVRRLLEARDLDVAGLYDVLPDGRLRVAEVQ